MTSSGVNMAINFDVKISDLNLFNGRTHKLFLNISVVFLEATKASIEQHEVSLSDAQSLPGKVTLFSRATGVPDV